MKNLFLFSFLDAKVQNKRDARKNFQRTPRFSKCITCVSYCNITNSG